MDVRIEVNESEQGCKVWLDDAAVSFPSVEDAQAYVDKLEERINAPRHSFGAEIKQA